MRLVDAVYERVIELVKERRITVNALANLSGVPRPTIGTMTKSSTVKLSTVYGICAGLKITLQQFFDSPLFDPENITD
ncbi:MAG TPA: helix-turn-helix transcriptional regulator [Firmicutes bacterium]|nr:helix-turn-helix transcriptional regulator [Bacillota bacterium]